MLYFSRWKAAAILVDRAHRLPVRRAEFLLRADACRAGRNGRSATSCSGSTCRAARTSCSRSTPTRCARRSSSAARRRAPRAARRAHRLHRPRRSAATASRCASARQRSPAGADQAARAVAAARRPARARPASARVDVTDAGGGLVRLTVTEPALTERVRQAVEQSIQIVERRVNELGTVEPSIQRQGVDRILVQVPGLRIRRASRSCSARPPSSTFRMVDTTDDAGAGAAGPAAAGIRSSLRHREGRQASPT